MKPIPILVAEDNEFDRTILKQAFAEIDFNIVLEFVENGEELLDCLHRRKAYAPAAGAAAEPALPALILMDLNMPRMDGNEALRELRASAALRMLPVVILSTSDNPKQIAQAYANGANAFMTKPGPFEDVVELLRKFGAFWLEAVQLPTEVPHA